MRRITGILILLLLCFNAYSHEGNLTNSQTEQKSKEIEIYFDQGSHAINIALGSNGEHLEDLKSTINKLQAHGQTTISKIEISSYTSPEGGRSYNRALSINRTNAIYDYLIDAVSVPDSIITKLPGGIDWDGLYNAVEASDMEHKTEVLHIIKNVPEETWRRVNPNDRWLSLVDSRVKHLRDLKGGAPYRWIYANIFPQLRRGSIITIYFRVTLPSLAKGEIMIVPTEQKSEVSIIKEVSVAEPEPIEEIKPLLALKTNLLYDAVTAANIELEIPIGQRWSVAGEWIFPWWTSCGNSSNDWQNSSNRNTFQLLQGNIEGKYWLGDRTNRPVMTGWHVGLYAGGGLYDFERNAKGYQGEFFIAAGLSGGYAHTINESGNLRMEYSVGVGYLKTQYRYYEEHLGIDNTWHTIRQSTGNYTWFGPTRARVSLVWLFNRKANKER